MLYFSGTVFEISSPEIDFKKGCLLKELMARIACVSFGALDLIQINTNNLKFKTLLYGKH